MRARRNETSMLPRVFDRDQIARALTPELCVAAVERATRDVSCRRAVMLPRVTMPFLNGTGYLGVMAGEVSTAGTVGAKLASIVPRNAEHGRPVIQAVIVCFDPHTGAPLAVLEGTYITEQRTAAMSALATRVLARPDVRTLTVLGAGAQARAHLRVLSALFAFQRIQLWARDLTKAEQAVASLPSTLRRDVHVLADLEQAVGGADVICSVTSARDPLINAHWVKPGTHLNLVGSHSPDAREAEGALMARALVFVDHREFAQRDAGDIVLALAEGEMTPESIIGELGEVLEGIAPGRRTPSDITIFKSLGLIVQDLAAARAVLDAIA
jgi:alanine dehydrogenase